MGMRKLHKIQKIQMPNPDSFTHPQNRPAESEIFMKKSRFEDTHTRFTTYLENDLYEQIKGMRQSKQLSSITKLVNAAIHAYLDTHL